MGYFDHVQPKVWVTRCTSHKVTCNSKTVGRKWKWIDIWGSETPVTHTWHTFDLVVFNVIWGSFSTIVCNLKIAGRMMKIGDNSITYMEYD